MKTLNTRISLVRVAQQYKDARAMGIDVSESDKFEYKSNPFTIVLGKVSGYSPNEDHGTDAGVPITSVFLGSEYACIEMDYNEFDSIMKSYLYRNK